MSRDRRYLIFAGAENKKCPQIITIPSLDIGLTIFIKLVRFSLKVAVPFISPVLPPPSDRLIVLTHPASTILVHPCTSSLTYTFK